MLRRENFAILLQVRAIEISNAEVRELIGGGVDGGSHGRRRSKLEKKRTRRTRRELCSGNYSGERFGAIAESMDLELACYLYGERKREKS